MGKESAARKASKLRYRKNSTHSLVILFPNRVYAIIDTYCKHINSPVATWVRKLIWEAIDSDPTFSYDKDGDNE